MQREPRRGAPGVSASANFAQVNFALSRQLVKFRAADPECGHALIDGIGELWKFIFPRSTAWPGWLV